MNYMQNKQLNTQFSIETRDCRTTIDIHIRPNDVLCQRRKSLSYTFTNIFTVVNWSLYFGDGSRSTKKKSYWNKMIGDQMNIRVNNFQITARQKKITRGFYPTFKGFLHRQNKTKPGVLFGWKYAPTIRTTKLKVDTMSNGNTALNVKHLANETCRLLLYIVFHPSLHPGSTLGNNYLSQ